LIPGGPGVGAWAACMPGAVVGAGIGGKVIAPVAADCPRMDGCGAFLSMLGG
jgi:hypothetical protein